jgi:hypothetical protein
VFDVLTARLNPPQLQVEKAAAAAGTPYNSSSSPSRAQKIADAHKWSKKYGENIIGQLKVVARMSCCGIS